MHDMDQTEAEYLRHSKRSQTASVSQIEDQLNQLTKLKIPITRYLLRTRKIGHVTYARKL